MSASTARKSLVRATEDGERRWFFGGGLHIWKATADDTDGAFLLFEDRMDHGKVTPLHLHPDSDETMIVLEGEILMHLDGDRAHGPRRRHRQRPARHPARLQGLRRRRRPAAVPAHTWLLPGVLLGRQRARPRPMTAGASMPGRWTWVACRPRPRRTAASRSSVRPRSARSLRADLAGPRQRAHISRHADNLIPQAA